MARSMASDPDQEYIHFMGKRFLLPVTYFPTNNASFYLLHTFAEYRLPSAYYILSDESSIPFYSGVTGIKILIYEQL